MKLGLLFETGIDVASVKERPTFVTFQHKLMQEYAGGYYVQQTLEKSTDIQVLKHNFQGYVTFFFVKNVQISGLCNPTSCHN